MPLTAGYRTYLQSSHRNETRLSSSALSRWQAIGTKPSRTLSLLLGACVAVFAPAAHAQASPQMLPYVNNIYAGSGTSYTPTTLKGSTTTPVHGTSPGDGGSATAAGAQLNGPTHIAVDSLGTVYFTDSSGPVRKVDTNGNITTFAGGLASGAGDCAASPTNTIGDGCPANETNMKSPYGIAIDPASGDIYISENTGARIRKVSHSTYLMSSVVDVAGTKSGLDGDLTTCSTTPGATCSGTAGTVSGPRGLAVDKHGNLYIMDEGNFAVRLANFTNGQLTTVVNAAKVKATTTTCGTDATTGGVTASSASLGVAGAIAFDSADNLYITDSTCNYVFKVAENPATGMVDGNSILTVVIGSGPSTALQTTFTNQLGTTVIITPAGVVADPLGNLYVGESTGNHVWFWDHATGYMHTVFGGGTSGNCYGVTGSGTSPYNGCDGFDSALAATKGTGGLALDAWGNLYIADSASFYVHKLSLGTNAPPSTAPANPNALLHVGANDTYASVSTTLAPAFAFALAAQGCTVSAPPGDNTQDCDIIVTNTNASTNAQYEQVTVTTTVGLSSAIPLTNQVFPTCQGAEAISQSVLIQGASTPVTLSFQPGEACTGAETVALAPHKYSYGVVSQPVHGTLSGTAPALSYTPNAGYTGSDSFTFSVTDNNTFSAATIPYDGSASSITLETPAPLAGFIGTITLQPYSPPVATLQSVTVTYQTAQAITLTGTDSNSATLTFTAPSTTAHGTLNGTAPNLTYTPAASYSGPDSFTFTVSDGVSTSSPGTIAITVSSPAPVPTNPVVSVNFQTSTAVTLGATGQGPITYAVTTQPINGTLSGTAPNLTYAPSSTYSGPDTFTYTATNAGGAAIGTVSITVGQPPLIPTPQNSSATVAFNTATPIAAIAGGGNGHALSYILATGPAHGTLSAFTGAVAIYTPTTGYVGADSFIFKVTDGTTTSPTAGTVSITVNQSAPVANSQSVTTAFATPVSITLVATGPPTITYAVVTAPVGGTLSGTAPNLTYTPNSNFAGADSFTFKANNGGDSNIATVSITVTAPPIAQPQTLTDTYNGILPITLAATGNGMLTYAVTTQPIHGTVSISGAVATYTPIANYTGSDSFTFTANNGSVSNTAKVSITVLPLPPVASNLSATTNYNTPVTIPLASGVTDTIVTQPTNGTLTLVGTTAMYTPATNFAGTDSFTYTESNAGGTSNIATATITVGGGFSWSAASGAALTATVTNGQTATYNLQISGWTSSSGVAVSFACTGAPLICNTTPNPATLKGTTAVPVMVTINTLTTSATPMGLTWVSGSGRSRPWLLILNLAWIAFIVPLARKRRKLYYRMVLAFAAIVILASVSGCGGNIPEQAFGTPAGTYTLTLTASAVGATSTTQQITLIVN